LSCEQVAVGRGEKLRLAEVAFVLEVDRQPRLEQVREEGAAEHNNAVGVVSRRLHFVSRRQPWNQLSHIVHNQYQRNVLDMTFIMAGE
jgi:hypothetical protein